MQVEEHLLFLKLFDEYGKLLSKKQQLVMDMHLNLDIGESEIAESQNETRQSIHDAISKAKKQLLFFEEQCGFVERKTEIENACLKIKALLNENKILDIENKIDEIINLL